MPPLPRSRSTLYRGRSAAWSGARCAGRGGYGAGGGGGAAIRFAIEDDDGAEVMIAAAVGGNDARFINHSCDPNCDAVVEHGRVWIETIRDVVPGEELAYDYALVLEERHTPAAKRRFPCRCGAPTCRGTMLAKKR